MFRGKESSNRIELSQLVKELLNFGVLGSLWLWGWGVSFMGCRGWEVPPTHVHMHTRIDTHMYRNCKWLPTWRHPCLSCLACLCMCVHACGCVCAWNTPTPPYPPLLPSTHLPPPRGEPMESVKI